MTRGKSKPKQLEQVARDFAAQVLATTKRRNPAAEARRDRRVAAVSRALAEHLAKRKK